MTEDESEVFEITDFTTASDWERFIARFEEIIHEWKLTNVEAHIPLSKDELSSATWEELTQKVSFAGFDFIVTKHKISPKVSTKDGPEEDKAVPKASVAESKDQESDQAVPIPWQDMMSMENDFPARAHCLCRWYGLREFVLVAPAPGMGELYAESRASILLSSITIAINNTSCQVPVFIQVHQWRRKLFQGCHEVPGFRTSFEMVHLKNTPAQYKHLSGLLDVFKLKIACPISPMPPVSVAVRFTYQLSDWMHYNWCQVPPDIQSYSGEELGITEFGELPFGACEDPVSELQLSTTWPGLSEEMVVDNDVYTDLDPLQAPIWSTRVIMQDSPLCLLELETTKLISGGDSSVRGDGGGRGCEVRADATYTIPEHKACENCWHSKGDYLHEFVQLCRRGESTEQLLPKAALDAAEDVDVSQALDRLTNPGYKVPSLGTVVTRATSKLQIRPEEAPIPKDLLNEILMFLFPDARADAEKMGKGKSSLAPDQVDSKPSSSTDTACSQESMELFKQFKSAPQGSFTYRLAVCMCIVNHSYGGLRALAHLWQEIVLEMRYRWENNYQVPDIDSGPPNMGCSLLYQKFQMLNCCIERKKSRESSQSGSPRNAPGQSPSQDELNKTAKDLLNRSLSISSSDDEFYECDDDDKDSDTASKPRSRKSVVSLDVDKLVADAEKGSSQSSEDNVGKNSAEELSEKRKRLSAQETMDTSLFIDSFTHQAEGRLNVFGELTLLNVPNEKLYVPVTQEPALMTEDMLEEHAVVLEKLGTSSEGAHLRARMQSACLLSDMESFKAANPGAILGDFVRWYSPRDWVTVEEEEEDGNVTVTEQLSQRMQIPGNMWVEVWQSAKPIPARRQRRLFDDTKEAEKVLHYLSSMKPSDVVIHLMPMLMHAAFVKLLQQEESSLPAIKTLLSATASKAAKAMRMPNVDIKRFEELVRQISHAEMLCTRAQSLQQKFEQEAAETRPPISTQDIAGFVHSLMENPEVVVTGAARGPLGVLVHKLFQTAQKSAYMVTDDDIQDDATDGDGGTEPTVDKRDVPDFPTPVAREYILRACVARPAPWSRPSPQRMFCVLVQDEFRLAGAFTADTTFQ